MRKILLAMLLAGACTTTSDGDSSLTIANESSFFIDQIHVAEVNDPNWGPDLISDLAPGEEVTIVLDCGNYDVLVVDETGVECQLSNVDLCFDDDVWVIDDVTLDVCAFGP